MLEMPDELVDSLETEEEPKGRLEVSNVQLMTMGKPSCVSSSLWNPPYWYHQVQGKEET